MNSIIDISVSSSSALAVSVQEAKNYLHIDYANDDWLIDTLIRSATKRLEKYTGCAFLQANVEALICIEDTQELPYGPVGDITSVMKDDGDGNFAATTDYKVYGIEFKTIVPDVSGTYKISYQAGWGQLPQDLRLAVLAEVAYQFENRGDDNTARLSHTAKELAGRYRRLSTTL